MLREHKKYQEFLEFHTGHQAECSEPYILRDIIQRPLDMSLFTLQPEDVTEG